MNYIFKTVDEYILSNLYEMVFSLIYILICLSHLLSMCVA